MDFKDILKNMSERIEKLKDQIKTEEATKNALIMPFIQALVQFETVPSRSEENLVDTLQKDLKKLTKIYTNENLKPLVHFSNQLKPVFIEFIKEKKMRSRLTAVVKEQLLEKANQLKAETLPNTPFEPFRIPVAWMLSHLKNSKISEEMK